jgi:hypothetical protein
LDIWSFKTNKISTTTQVIPIESKPINIINISDDNHVGKEIQQTESTISSDNNVGQQIQQTESTISSNNHAGEEIHNKQN